MVGNKVNLTLAVGLSAIAVLLLCAQPCFAQAEEPEVGDLLYSDNFTSRKESGWTTYSDKNYSQYYKDGEYNIEIFQTDWRRCKMAPSNLQLEDFVLEVEATQKGGPDDNAFGVVTRFVDNGNSSGFVISGDGFYGHWQRVDNKLNPSLVWSRSAAIKTGSNQSNSLRVVSQKERIIFYVNGEKLAEYTDSRPVAGNIGLWAEAYVEGGVHISFDNLRVWALKE